MKKHVIRMIVGCLLPLLLIFFAPALGLGSNTSLFIFIVAMFACPLLMPMHHGRHEDEQQASQAKNEHYGHH